MSKDKDNSSDSEIVTPKNREHDRRVADPVSNEPVPSVRVDHDSRGSTVLNVTTVTPRRRADDDTVNLQKLLDVDSLSIDDDDGPLEDGSDESSDGGNPKE